MRTLIIALLIWLGWTIPVDEATPIYGSCYKWQDNTPQHLKARQIYPDEDFDDGYPTDTGERP